MPEIDLDSFRQIFDEKWADAVSIWSSGGWAMIAIAVIALVMFAMGVHIYVRIRELGFLSISERRWRRWLTHPLERKGPVGELIDHMTSATSIKQTRILFEQLRTTETIPFERDLKIMKICVSAAPLVGLLGTVTGMLSTFGALSSGSGGDQTMGMVAKGISEALITTETGLVIALPGLFFQNYVASKFAHYKAFIAQLESACTQLQHRAAEERHKQLVKEATVELVAQHVEGKLAAEAS